MALNYSVALRPNPLKKDEPAKAYATAQVNGELSLKQLSRRVSMQTTVSRGVRFRRLVFLQRVGPKGHTVI